MDKLIDEILAIYKRIDKGEIEEEEEARKELRRKIENYVGKVKLETLDSVDRLLDVVDKNVRKRNDNS